LTPNKGLKVAGGDRFKGTGVFAPWRARTNVQRRSAAGESPAAYGRSVTRHSDGDRGRHK